MTYHPEGGGEFSLQLSDPAATETTLTNIQCNTNYTITVVTTAGEHKRESVARTVYLPVQGIPQHACIFCANYLEVVSFESHIILAPVEVRAEASADNTSIRVSWQWSCQGVPMCVDLVRVDYQTERGTLMMFTVDNTTATSVTLPNLKCKTEYTVWVQVRGIQLNKTSAPKKVYLPARGMLMLYNLSHSYCICSMHCTTSAPPTPTDVTAWLINASSLRVAWQWTSSGPAPNCFNTTHVTYRPEGGGGSSLQLSDPAANEATLTDLQNNRCYTITVVATAGEHRKESVALQGEL